MGNRCSDTTDTFERHTLSCRLDYCNSLLAGVYTGITESADVQPRRFQSVHAAARL